MKVPASLQRSSMERKYKAEYVPSHPFCTLPVDRFFLEMNGRGVSPIPRPGLSSKIQGFSGVTHDTSPESGLCAEAPGSIPVTAWYVPGQRILLPVLQRGSESNPGKPLLILPDLSHPGIMDSKRRRTHRSSSGAGPLTGARQAVSR